MALGRAYKIGIQDAQFIKTVKKAGLDPELYGPVLFGNWKQAQYLMIKKSIISKKTLKAALVKAGFLYDDDPIPAPIEKIFEADGIAEELAASESKSRSTSHSSARSTGTESTEQGRLE